MATQTEVLTVLSTKEEATSPKSIATELKAGEGTMVTSLNRLKKKGFVDGGGQEWYITDAGRKNLESAKKVPITKEDVGEDELSKFQWFGQLSGVDLDVITAAVELFQNTDMRSMTELERVLAEMNVPGTQRTKWKNLYRDYLRNTTPPEKREQLYPLPSPEEVREAEERAAGEGGEKLDYIVEENNILRIGDGLGMFTFKQALQVVAAKRGTIPQGAPSQQWGPDELLKIVKAVQEFAPSGAAAPKSYMVTQGEEGAIVQEVESGKPVVLQQPASQPRPTYTVDTATGEVKELQPGQPIVVVKQPAAATPPQKTFIVKQTPEGTTVVEEHDLSKPIIIQAGAPGGGLPAMFPFPAMGADGKPIVGQDGKPVYVDIEPMMKWMGFQSEQRRSDERHSAIMGLASTIKENLPIAVEAFNRAVSEVKGKAPESAAQQYECGECHAKFTLPRQPGEDEMVECPNCHHQWPSKEVIAT